MASPDEATRQKLRDNIGNAYKPIRMPLWINDIHVLTETIPCDLAHSTYEFEDVIKLILAECHDIYKRSVRLHQIKELWIIHNKATTLEWPPETRLSAEGIDHGRILATSVTFINYVRLWAKMIHPPLQLALGFCLFCSSVHNMDDCHLYKNEEERTLRLRDLGLCPRCLGCSHESRNCGSACSACGRHHHEILCDKYLRQNRNCNISLRTRHIIDQLLENAFLYKSFLDICWKDDDYMPFPLEHWPAIPQIASLLRKVPVV